MHGIQAAQWFAGGGKKGMVTCMLSNWAGGTSENALTGNRWWYERAR